MIQSAVGSSAMAAANGVDDDFESWLSFKLLSLKTDESVFSSYISGILNGEETIDEKTEALEGILSEITDSDISTHSHEILEHWRHSRGLGDGEASSEAGTDAKPAEGVDERLVKLMESNTKTMAVTRKVTDEEKRIKEAILAHYSQTSDHEFDSDTEVDKKGSTKEDKNGIEKNTNAAAVAQAVKEKREKAKLESQKKKEKDKEDREKQKQQQQEKKEKRKTQKGERRR